MYLNRLRSDFLFEWGIVCALGLLDTIWARFIDLHILLSWGTAYLLLGILGVCAVTKVFAPGRIAGLTEYFSLSLVGTFALMVFSYLCLASAKGPLFDPMLLAADRALGFDWLSLYRGLMKHPALAHVLQLIYDSLIIQGLYCTLLLGLMQRRKDMKDLWRLTFLISVICCLGAMAFPALGPFKLFGLDSQGVFLPDMERLLSHRNLVFKPTAMTGVVCFPSLHTAMALAYTYALRRMGPILYLFLALNLLMLFSIPFFGGHYLTDMIAGAAVMLVALGLVHLWSRLEKAGGAAPVPVLVETAA